MATEVADKTVAVVEPASPLERMIRTLFVGPHLRRAAPEIPVETRGDGIGLIQVRRVPGPGMVVVPDVDVGDLSEQAGFNQLNASS